jgi:DnaJ-class molecular chaperone
MFFGGGGRGRGGPAKKQVAKCKPTKVAFKVSLEDIYNGKIVKFENKRTRCCEKCNGKGGENVETCKQCKGKGMVIQMYQMGPGMYQQVQKHCDKCKGEG